MNYISSPFLNVNGKELFVESLQIVKGNWKILIDHASQKLNWHMNVRWLTTCRWLSASLCYQMIKGQSLRLPKVSYPTLLQEYTLTYPRVPPPGYTSGSFRKMNKWIIFKQLPQEMPVKAAPLKFLTNSITQTRSCNHLPTA